jgi:hypothetical protein
MLMARTAIARGRQDSRKRTILIQTEKKRRNNRQTATVENVRTENAVLRTEYKQSDKNPKGGITLVATSHKKPPVSAAGVCKM